MIHVLYTKSKCLRYRYPSLFICLLKTFSWHGIYRDIRLVKLKKYNIGDRYDKTIIFQYVLLNSCTFNQCKWSLVRTLKLKQYQYSLLAWRILFKFNFAIYVLSYVLNQNKHIHLPTVNILWDVGACVVNHFAKWRINKYFQALILFKSQLHIFWIFNYYSMNLL